MHHSAPLVLPRADRATPVLHGGFEAMLTLLLLLLTVDFWQLDLVQRLQAVEVLDEVAVSAVAHELRDANPEVMLGWATLAAEHLQ
eukprot:Skav234286  [mRNA]  locus=scaffold2271:37614:39208:- [translate_table: standard]